MNEPKLKNEPKLPKVIEEHPDGTITVYIHGKGENGGPIERSQRVSGDYVEKIIASRKLGKIKRLLKKHLDGKDLKTFIPNKKHRKALYAVLVSLELKHEESIEETAFYIKELYGQH